MANLSLDRGEWTSQCLRKLLPEAVSHVVSDIGAGFGWMKSEVVNAGGVWQGFDSIHKIPGVSLWDVEQSAPEQSTRPGIVLLLEVLEHFRNPWLAVKNIGEHLLPGGYLVMTVPNPQWSRSRLYLLNHGVLYAFTPKHLAEHHVFTTWPHVVERILSDSGFEILEYVTLDPQPHQMRFPGAPYNSDFLKRVCLYLACKFIERIDPSARGYTYGVVARKVA